MEAEKGEQQRTEGMAAHRLHNRTEAENNSRSLLRKVHRQQPAKSVAAHTERLEHLARTARMERMARTVNRVKMVRRVKMQRARRSRGSSVSNVHPEDQGQEEHRGRKEGLENQGSPDWMPMEEFAEHRVHRDHKDHRESRECRDRREHRVRTEL